MSKRRAYTRRKSGETKAHDKRARSCIEINATEIRAACDAALRRKQVPINHTEELCLKKVVKDMKKDRDNKK